MTALNQSVELASKSSASYSAFPFLFMDSFLATSRGVCILIGIPLNLLTAAFITLSPRFHQTRNILWLGVAFSNVFVLSTDLVELIAYWCQCEKARKIYSVMSGLQFVTLMMNLLLSLLDRYISITYSAWYKRNVTISWIISGQIACFSTICVLVNPVMSPVLPELFSDSKQVKVFFAIGCIGFLLCIFGGIFFYIKVRSYLALAKTQSNNRISSLSTHRAAENENRGDSTGQQHQAIDQKDQVLAGEPRESHQENPPSALVGLHHNSKWSKPLLRETPVITSPPYFIRIGNQAMSRRELKAARHALDSVTLYLAFSFPTCITVAISLYFNCFTLTTSSLVRPDCSTYLWALAYTRGLVLIYPVVNPVFFILRNRELLLKFNAIRSCV